METQLAPSIQATLAGQEAESILRKCVHCGFCTATCPTYQLFGDELDGPRGRIYLIKQMLEGGPVSEKTRLHLDRCLLCRSCETTCPSGVRYHHLLDVGRNVMEQRVTRPPAERLLRFALRRFLPQRWLFLPAYRLAQLLRPLLPTALRHKVLPYRPSGARPRQPLARSMIALAGCVQQTMAPSINAAAARVLHQLGIHLQEAASAGCCGALPQHLDGMAQARENARRNIDAWWPLLEVGAEAILMTASGCATQVRDYGHLLQDDPAYAAKAVRVSGACKDIGEILAAEKGQLLALFATRAQTTPLRPLAYHAPCSLQHGLQIRGLAEDLLSAAGYTLTPVADAHLCCGSGGAYSVLQTKIATQLQQNKLAALTAGKPTAIATANIGCLAFLQSGTRLPVRHWIEFIDERLTAPHHAHR